MPVIDGAIQRASASLSIIASGSNHLPSYSRRPRRRPMTMYWSVAFSFWIADSKRS